MPIDDRTTNRSYQLPNAGNLLSEDVARLRLALTAIDADVFARYTKAEVDQKIADLINGSPGALDTLNELAAAMGSDPNFAATITNALAGKPGFADVWTRAQADARYVQGINQVENVFTGTGSQTTFTLTQAPPSRESILVSVDGVLQPVSAYTLSGTGLILSEAPVSGASIRVLMLGVAAPVQSASTLSFAQADLQAITRSVASKLQDVVSVMDFGAVGNGVADDTAAIQAALNFAATKAHGCKVLADGFFKVSATLTGTGEGVCLGGSSRGSCRLIRAADYGHTVRFIGQSARLGWVGLENAFIENTGSMTSGSHVVFDNCYSVVLSNCIIKNGYNGLSILGVDEGYIRNLTVSANTGSPTGRCAIEIGVSTVTSAYGGDLFFDGVNLWCGTKVAAPGTAITPCLDYGFKISAVDGLWLNNVHVIATKAANYLLGNTSSQPVLNVYASQAMSDICHGNGIELSGTATISDVKWVGRVSALGESLAGSRGVSITAPCSSVTLECSIDGFDSDGVYINNASARNIDLVSPQIRSNDYDNGGTAGSGINIVSGQEITISGGFIKGDSIQDWGVQVGAGASQIVIDGLRIEDHVSGGIQLTSGASSITITNCDLRNNSNLGGVPILIPGGISNLYIDGCPGFTPLYATAIWNPGAITAGQLTYTSITVAGAEIGDAVFLSSSADLLGLNLYGYVSSTNTVTAVLGNIGSPSTDLPSLTVYARVEKRF